MAGGRVLAPGFIDVHTHDDINVIRMPEYLPKLSRGVTTVIVGNCGISAATATMRGGSAGPDESPSASSNTLSIPPWRLMPMRWRRRDRR